MSKKACILGLLVISCSSAPPPPAKPLPRPPVTSTVAPDPAPEWTLGAWPAHLPAERFAAAVATSTDAKASHTKALAALEVRLFGPPEKRPFAALPPELRDFVDPALTREHSSEGITTALVAVSKTHIQQRLDDWAQAQTPDTELPERHPDGERVLVFGEQVHDARDHLNRLIEHLRYRRAAHFVCQDAPVRTSTCSAPDPRILQDSLQAFTSGIQLRSTPTDGVPYRAGLGALRKITVHATWNSPGRAPEPLAQVPVQVKLPNRTLLSETDADGRVHIPWPNDAPLNATAKARIASSLLAELQSFWADPPSVDIVLRELRPDRSRVALSIKEASVGRHSTDGSERLRQGLLSAGWAAVYYLDEGRTPAQPVQAAALSALADQAQGQLDVLLMGDLEVHFASQMGARSVWYEATGELTVYDAWTGRPVAVLKDSARAVAIGEAAAAKAALEALGGQLADKVIAAMRAYQPPALLQ